MILIFKKILFRIIIFKRFFLNQNKEFFFWKKTYSFTKKFIKLNKNLRIGLEVGVAAGSHIDSILKNTSVKKMYGVDPYLFYERNDEKPLIKDLMLFFKIYSITKESKKKIFNSFFELAKKKLSKYGRRVELIRKSSKAAAEEFKNRTLDFVFIDANHSFKNCYQDIQLWYPKIKMGGYLMGHDYNMDYFPGVVRAVNKSFKRERISVDLKSEVWFVKKIN